LASGHAASKATPSRPTFSAAVQPILTDNCVACHQARSAQLGLVLEEGESFAHLVGRKSRQAPLALVKPGKPDESYLIRKLEGSHLKGGGSGVRMPLGTPLDAQSINTIRQWVAGGAKND
jgi:mono/diheme cytochrome c family protein